MSILNSIRQFFEAHKALAACRESVLALEKDLQTLRLDQEEKQRLIAMLKEDLARQHKGENELISESVDARLEQLLSDAAPSVSQLLTQVHLLEVERRSLQPEDMLTVGKRLVKSLTEHGLQIDGEIGKVVPFDMNYHECLGGEPANDKDKVVVRMLGVSYNGKVLRRAAVVRASAVEAGQGG